MTNSLVICDGATKSGSTLLFRITEAILGSSKEFLKLGEFQSINHVIDTYDDNPTGYISNPNIFLGSLLRVNNIPLILIPNTLVIKAHGFSLQDHDIESINIRLIHLYTIRDPLDNIRSLMDASQKEQINRLSGLPVRADFEKLTTANKAAVYLYDQYRFILQEASSRPIHIIEYPDYMNPGTHGMENYCTALGLDPLVVAKATADVDRRSKKGEIWTEYNVGIVGRGRSLQGDLDSDLLAKITTTYDTLRLLSRS